MQSTLNIEYALLKLGTWPALGPKPLYYVSVKSRGTRTKTQPGLKPHSLKAARKKQDRDSLVRVVGVNGPPHDVQMVEVGPRRVGHNDGEAFPGRLEDRVRLIQPKGKAANRCSSARKLFGKQRSSAVDPA